MARKTMALTIGMMLVTSILSLAGELIQTVTFDRNCLLFDKVGGYDRIELAGVPSAVSVGAPRLPRLVQALAIPAGAVISGVEIVSVNETELDGTYDVIPAQKAVPLPMPGKTFKTEPPSPDAKIYGSDAIYPASILQSRSTGSMCGYRIGHVEINPVRYNPVTKKLYFSESITYRVRYQEGKAVATVPTKDQQGLFGQQVKMLVANPEAVESFAPRISREAASKALPAGEYRSVIISGSAMFDTVFTRLAAWHTKKGCRDTVINVSSIYSSYTGYDNIERIRNFIIDAKDTWGTMFVLLGGQGDDLNAGENLIPARHAYYIALGAGYYPDEDQIPSDWYYSDLDGTWDADGDHTYGELTDNVNLYSDVFVGRAPVLNVAQAQNFVAKTLNYEKNNPGSYLKKMLLPSAILWDSYEERPIQRAIAAMTPAGWQDDSLFERNGTLSQAAMVASMNDGRGLGHWMGHGDPNGIYMGSAYYTSTNADSASNGNNQGVHISITCFAGAMDEVPGGDCMAEHIINRVGGGAVGVIMNSRFGWGAISGDSYVAGPSDRLDTTFYHVLFHDGIYRQGQMLSSAKAAWVPYADSTEQYDMTRWCIYELNLFGDPSLPVWTENPVALTVGHPGTVPIGYSDFTITVTDPAKAPVRGALVCLMTSTKDSYVYDTTDVSGQVTLHPMPASACQTMYITVTARNHTPYEGSVSVVSPARVTIVPDTVSVMTTTPVTVTVTDTLLNPLDSIVISIGGYGVSPALVDTTDGSGQAQFNICALYGENLQVVGRELGEAYDMFTDTLYVKDGLALSSPVIAASVPAIGLAGAVMPGFAGQFASQADAGYTLYVNGCGINAGNATATEYDTVVAIAATEGTVSATIGKSGYNLYAATFPCRTVYGTLSGKITGSAGGDSLPGARVLGFAPGSPADTLFDALTGANGVYTMPDSLVCGQYELHLSKFGYLGEIDTILLQYGANVRNYALDAAPSGAVSGAVTEDSTGFPLAATVNVYRSDDGSLYATTATDSAAGGTYSVPTLPYFNYRFEVRASRHRKAVRTVTVSSGSQTENFALAQNQGDILVINDDNGTKGEHSKVTGYDKQGNAVVVTNNSGTASKAGESATQMAAMLTELGYTVTEEASSATIEATWPSYDVVVWSDGRDEYPLSVAADRTNLINYVTSGGKLLLEGGEIAHRWDTEDAAFASGVMHANDWDRDNAGALTVRQAGHPLATTPNALPASLAVAYSVYGDEDATKATNGGVVVYGTAIYPANGGIIAYDAGGDPDNGNVVFYAFNFNVLADSVTRALVLENSIEYLLRPNTPATGSVSGTVTLNGLSTHEGVTVAITGYPAVTTNAAGAYQLSNLYNGTYAVTAGKMDYTTRYDTVTVSGGAVNNVNFTLFPVAPVITHTPLANTINLHGPYKVTMTATDTCGVFPDSSYIHFRINSGAEQPPVQMACIDDLYTGLITLPADISTWDTVNYYLTAVDMSSRRNVGRSPAAGYYSFVMTDSVMVSNFDSPDAKAMWDTTGGTHSWRTYTGASHSSPASMRTGTSNYANNADYLMTLKPDYSYNLDAYADNSKWVRLFYWSRGRLADTTTRLDTLFVEASKDNVTWTKLKYNVKYFSLSMFIADTIDLTSFLSGKGANDSIIVRFHLKSDASGNSFGWLVDDVYLKVEPVTGIAGKPEATSSLPQAYHLGSACPNPARSAVSIAYQLPVACDVELAVYNITGQKVRTLAGGSKPAGYHTARWDGRDEAGQPVSAGIYLYRLVTPEYSRTNKLSLVR